MKRTKKTVSKVLSIVLALCLIMSFAVVPASAAAGKAPSAEIKVGKLFTVDSPYNITKMEYATFELAPYTYTDAGDVIYAAADAKTGSTVLPLGFPMPLKADGSKQYDTAIQQTTEKFAVDSSDNTKSTGSVNFGSVPFDKVGVYTYKVSEVIGTPIAGITYDDAPRFVNVYVVTAAEMKNTDDDENKYNDLDDAQLVVAAITIWENDNVVTMYTDPILNDKYTDENDKVGTGIVDGEGNGQAVVDFHNYFGDVNKETMIEIYKNVAGSSANKDEQFKFWLYLKEDTASTDLAFQVFDSNNKFVEDVPASDPNNTTGAVIKKSGRITVKNNLYVEFYLKHGEHVRIYNVKSGTEYYVTEQGAVDYNTEINGTSGGTDYNVYGYAKTTLSNTADWAPTIFTLNNVDNVNFLNKKGFTPPTGVAMDILPYALLIVLVGAAAVVLFGRKRRSSDR